MNESGENVGDLEDILKQQAVGRPAALYAQTEKCNSQNTPRTLPSESISAEDVITSVAKQLKAIQRADCVRIDKKRTINMYKYKKSSFMPVNMLPREEEEKPQISKFDTQHVSNTQLINIVQDAEALITNDGVTQEFETSFCQNIVKTDDDDKTAAPHTPQNKTLFPVLDISLKEPDPNKTVEDISLKVKDSNAKSSQHSTKVYATSVISDDAVRVCEEAKNGQKVDTQFEDCTQILNECIEMEIAMDKEGVSKKLDPFIEEIAIEEPLSPVFEVKSKKTGSTTPKHIVCDLESFEKFEKIAQPVIEESDDLEMAKRVINSQILGKELFIQTNLPATGTKYVTISPVIEISEEKLTVHKDSPTKKKVEERIKAMDEKTSEIQSETDNFELKDEILFSSDEENENVQTSYQDLPFTCALETSFYDQEEVLDKTVYVGFQTASDKPIQVSNVSFVKAKSFLDEENNKGPSLTELVKAFDSNGSANEPRTPNKEVDIKEFKQVLPNSPEMEEFMDADGANVQTEDNENQTQKIDLTEVEEDEYLHLDFYTPRELELKEQIQELNKDIQNVDIGYESEPNKVNKHSETVLVESKEVSASSEIINSSQTLTTNTTARNIDTIKEISEKSKHNDSSTICKNPKAADKDQIRALVEQEEAIMQEFEDELLQIELNESNGDKQYFIGFKTASNKKIEISDIALAKSKKILQDFDESPEIDRNNLSGNNKTNLEKLNQTQESTKHSQKKENHQNGKSDSKSDALKNPSESVNSIHSNIDAGFKTASNKPINVSDKALTKMKDVFRDINIFETDEKKNGVSNEVINVENGTENIEVDAQLLHDFSIDAFNQPSTSETKFIGFKTANNKDIKISEAALSKTKNIFKDIDEEKTFSKKNVVSPTTKERKREPYPEIKTHNCLQNFEKNDAEKHKTVTKTNAAATVTSQKEFVKATDITSVVSSEENKPYQEEPPFHGFDDTDNCLALFEEALAKSQKILEKLGCQDMAEDKEKTFVGFKTASNKKVNISEEAIAKSKRLFEDIVSDPNTDSVSRCTRSKTSNSSPEKSPTKSKRTSKGIDSDHLSAYGFRTASNKRVKISEEALAKSKTLFQDIDSAPTVTTDNQHNERKFLGFKTASNKKVNISEEALAKSKKLLQEIENSDQPSTSTSQSDAKFIGFQTASNKQVRISKEALAKSKKLFQDIDNCEQNDCATNTEKSSTTENNKRKFSGFQTASNKKVTVSKEALAKSKTVFQDLDSNNDAVISPVLAETKRKFEGFKTASNKKVKISEDALAKSKKLLHDLDDNGELFTETTNLETENKFIGFQTASNKKVNISEEALAKSKILFKDINDTDNQTSSTSNVNDVPKFSGFQTASNKKVAISEAALAKSKKVFEDIKIVNPDENVTEKTEFKGFYTASNKNVEVSKQSSAQSKNLLNNLDSTTNNSDNEPEDCLSQVIQIPKRHTRSSAFKTGTNKNVNISRGSLRSRNVTEPKTNLVDNNSDQKKVKDNLEDIINTQVANDFEKTLHSEDFRETPKKTKRSASPILSCPKSKKRKTFQIPYSQKAVEHKTRRSEIEPKVPQIPENKYTFKKDYKKSKKYNLKDLQSLEVESKNKRKAIDKYILQFHFENLLDFEFLDQRNDLSDTMITITDLKNIFLDSVSKKLVPDGWLDIHLKLIIWKLISYEIKFPKTMSYCCSAKNVLEQLKYRYDRELYNAERPALRKIMEKDDTSMRTLVLCVVTIYQDSPNLPELLLTDGWYTIRAVIDKMLAQYVQNGRITVGTKLVAHGAELVGGEQAVSPWENTSSIRLKLSGNSTRRARWHARLGYHGNAAILSSAAAISPLGGKVPRLRMLVSRVYPPLYVDKIEGGGTVTRSERLEHIYQTKYEGERQAIMEKLYEEVEKEVHEQESQDSEGADSGSKSKTLDSGSQIARMMTRSRDPAAFRSTLTSTQTALLEAHTCQTREKLIQIIQSKMADKMAAHGLNAKRNVVPLLKVRVVGVEEKNGQVACTRALLSVWKPNDAVVEMIKEGVWIEIMNVVPTSVRYSELQLSAGRQSVFSVSKYKESEKIKTYTSLLRRICYPIKDLVNNPAMTTDNNEIDTVGIVFQIDPSFKDFDPNKCQFQNVYLTDCDKNIICVNFWGGLKKFGFENVLDTGQVICCTNLQKRAGNTRKSIPHYRVTEFTYFTKTPKNDNARKMIEELSGKLLKIDKKAFFDECVRSKSNYSVKIQSNENISPYRFPNMDVNMSKNKIFLDSPLSRKNVPTEENYNLTGLDFESSFKQRDTQELSPKTLLRKQQVNKKIARLKMYGEPPPLSPIQIINKSKSAAAAYKSPLISKSVISSCVANEEKVLPNQKDLDAEIQCSPVIRLKRTYLNKSVNPVKLNFSSISAFEENNVSDGVDDFAEEFDGSPPLSLD